MAELQWGNLQSPNVAGSFQNGYAIGTQIKQQRQAEQDQNALRGLAPQIIAGDAGAYDQAAAINPEAANAYQGAGDNQLRRLKGFINYVDQARASNNPAAVNAALQAGSGFVGRFIGKPGPTEWTPDMEPGWEQLKAKVAMMESGGTQGRVQSTYVDGEGNRVAIMADGTQKILGSNDAGMSQQTISIPGPDGRPRQYTFDKRTGNYVPAGGDGQSSALGAPPPPPGTGGNPLPQGGTAQIVDAIAEQANRMIASGIPPEQVDAWAQSQQGAQSPGGNNFQNTQAVASGPSPFVGRSEEEEAAAVARAKGGVELDLLPQTEAIKRDSAIQQAVGIEAGKTQAERTAAAPATIATLQNSLSSIDALLDDPELGTIVGLGSLNPLNKIPGSKARGLAARADQVAGQAFLAAFNQLKGGGAITEREGAAATAAMARLDRSQGEEDYRQALMDLKAAIEPAMQRAQQQARGGQAASAPSAQRAVNPQTGEVLELRNGQWVPAQ